MALTQVPIELSSTPGIVDNSNTTAITIDSSENVLVGQTTNAETGTGIGLVPDGTSHMYSANTDALNLGRGGSDGVILTLNRSGTTVGSIGAASGDLNINGPAGHSGIRFQAGSILPRLNGADTDGTVDLGYDDGTSTHRWRNLYLSGGAYLGGTGSANKLDDYEEGTWTPITKAGATTITTTVSYAKYVKIGSLVYVTAYVTRNDTGSLTSFLSIEGLPFQVAAGSAQMSGSIWFDNTGTDEVATNYFVGSSSSFYPKKVAAGVDYVTADQFANNRPYYVSGVYQVAF